MSRPLRNARHERFCQSVAQGQHYQRAYELAGYQAKGRSAKVAASRLMTNVDIAERVQALIFAAAQGAEIKAEDVIRELARVAFSNVQDMRDLVNGCGDLGDLTRAHAAAIAEMTTDTISRGQDEAAIERIKVKLHPKIPALVKLGEHLGIFDYVNRNEVNVHFAVSETPLTDEAWEQEYGGQGDMGAPAGATDSTDPLPGP